MILEGKYTTYIFKRTKFIIVSDHMGKGKKEINQNS